MAEFNIDDVLGQFGKSKDIAPSKSGNLNVDHILSQFETKSEPVPKDIKKVYISGDTVPILAPGSKDSEPAKIKSLPVDDAWFTSPSAYENQKSGKELFSSGVEDMGSGHPYKGLGKAALGALGVVTAPVSGIIDDTIGKYGNKLGPGVGDRAGFVASSAIPIDMGLSKLNKVAGAIPILNKASTFSKNKALSELVEHIGQKDLPAVVSAMKANPRLAPADLSPRVLQDTQNLFVTEGKHINYLKNTSDTRIAGRKDAIENAYDATGGISPDLAQKVTDLANAAKKVGNDKINPALAAAKPVNVSNTVDAIDKILKPGVNSVISEGSSLPLTAVKKELAQIKTMLINDKEMRTGAQDLHKFQSGLRRTAEGLLKSSSGADREMGNALMNVRNNLVSDIDKSAPGYKAGLSGYRDEMHIADAFKQGHDNIFTSSKKIENDPSFTKKWFDGLTEHEQQAAKEGARAAIYTEMGVAKNPALAGESVARSDFNQAKMEILFGKEEAQKLFNKLAVERAIANTHNKIVEGSQTAMRTASKEGRALPTLKDIGTNIAVGTGMETANILAHGYPGVGTAMLATANLANRGSHAIKSKLARETNARYATYALPTEGPSRDELIRQLEARIAGPKPSLLNRGVNAMSRLVGP